MAISPSENLVTDALPRGVSKCLATRCANSGFALPVNTIKLSKAISSPAVWVWIEVGNMVLPFTVGLLAQPSAGIIRELG